MTVLMQDQIDREVPRSPSDAKYLLPAMDFPPWDNMAVHQGMPYLLSALITAIQPAVAVEAGTYRGHGAVSIGHTMHQIEHGHLHTADPSDYGQVALIQRLGLAERVTCHLTTYENMLVEVVGDRRIIDLAFVDASGATWDGTMRMRHLLLTYDRLAPGGIIVMDDIAATDWPFVNVIRDMAQLYLPGMRGIAIYQRRA